MFAGKHNRNNIYLQKNYQEKAINYKNLFYPPIKQHKF